MLVHFINPSGSFFIKEGIQNPVSISILALYKLLFYPNKPRKILFEFIDYRNIIYLFQRRYKQKVMVFFSRRLYNL